MLLALIGQFALEPAPQRTWTLGVVFYLAAAGMLVVAYRRGEWALPSHPALDALDAAIPRIRVGFLLLSLPLILAAFLSLSKNRFTALNVTLWLLAILTFCLALWQKEAPAQDLRQRLSAFYNKFHWQVVLTPWTLLMLAALALVIFFRVYRIGQVPPEMVSDQAEKLLDIWDVLQGQTSIFFPRNTGREAIQMYLTAGIIQLLGTGYSYLSLKIGTVLAGLLTLPFIYLLGKEIGGRRLGLLALVLAGIAYWPNVISRVGLRFPLYPLFVAPVLYYLVRGLRRRRFNDFILAGLWLGVGLHGYTPIRILPFVVVVGVGLFLLHPQSKGWRKPAFWGLVALGLVALVVFLPLLRYALENPDMFSYRSFTRLGSVEQPTAGTRGRHLPAEPVASSDHVRLGRRRDLGALGDPSPGAGRDLGCLFLPGRAAGFSALPAPAQLAGYLPDPLRAAADDAIDPLPGFPGGEPGSQPHGWGDHPGLPDRRAWRWIAGCTA